MAEEFHAQVTGVTLVPTQYSEALKLRPRRGELHFYLQNWLHNDLPAESFDCAIAIESSEHAVDKLQYFRQAARVLKPGGRLSFAAWTESDSANRLEKKYLLTPICDEGRLPSLCSTMDYRKVLEKAGFEILAEEDLTPKVKKTWKLVLRRMFLYFSRNPLKLFSALKAENRGKDFLLTPARMWAAYEGGSLRYMLMSARKIG